MNGPQDLGGQQGFGAVAPEADEPLFHAPWEARAMALTLACGALGAWTIDESRHARETLGWVTYYRSSYYEIWIRALETLLARHGFVASEERAAGRALRLAPEAPRVLRAEAVAGTLARGGPCDRPVAAPPRFAPGARVRTVAMNPEHHTRLPRYARDKPGVVEAVQGGFVFPDSNAHGGGERPQWVYTVVLRGEDLWGADADPGSEVSIDAWESYLEPA
ncbi:nitrile hydratase subunit beta [Amaricoccus solimangrovi]|uniref:Nitrile hydratase subunit beta n=1 Tax=Amaricoccus solimangrovi TaxID=2589815 RepID=A0A501WQ62_9RHOB|nr:nitrile hydratase subunit beta [Amaricoccus solimangrovi]TPE50490.1 nitrile hydratase subunit beta [Amaricoccus solimangrovi]